MESYPSTVTEFSILPTEIIIPICNKSLLIDLEAARAMISTKSYVPKKKLSLNMESELLEGHIRMEASLSIRNMVTVFTLQLFADHLLIERGEERSVELIELEEYLLLSSLDNEYNWMIRTLIRSPYFPLVLSKPSLFTISRSGYLESEKPIGKVYEEGRTESEVHSFADTRLWIRKEEMDQENLVVGFCVPQNYHDDNYARLVPFIASLGNNSDEIRSFKSFVCEGALDCLTMFSARQRKIYALMLQLEAIVEIDEEVTSPDQKLISISEIFPKSMTTAGEGISPKLQQTFRIWDDLAVLLQEEKYFYLASYTSHKHVKGKPKKSSMIQATLAEEPVRFSFDLKKEENQLIIYQRIHLGEDQVESSMRFPTKKPFFFMEKRASKKVFRIQNPLDLAIHNYFGYYPANLIAFEESHDDFNTKFLPWLTTYFQVNIPKSLNRGAPKNPKIMERSVFLQTLGHRILIIPRICYEDGRQVNPLTQGIHWLEPVEDGYRQIMRDRIGEEDLVRLIKALHIDFKKALFNWGFELPRVDFLDNFWFAEALGSLESKGVTIRGWESLGIPDWHYAVPEVKLDFQEESGWFDIGIQVQAGDTVVGMKELRKSVMKNDGLIQLKNGRTSRIPDSWQKQLQKVMAFGMEKNNGVRISRCHFPILQEVGNSTMPDKLKKWISRKSAAYQSKKERQSIQTPEGIQVELRPYQQEGVQWMQQLAEEEWGGILADDMGLGKTLQVLTFLQMICNLQEETVPNLVVVPTSLLFNWLEEGRKFAPKLRMTRYYGASRENLQGKFGEYDVIVTTYDIVKTDLEFLLGFDFQMLILDEAQAIKNSDTQRFQAINQLNAKQRIALSGTPVENSTMDLYALMNTVNPGFFGTAAGFRKNFMLKETEGKEIRMQALQTVTQPFILRRTKEQVAPELPGKTESVIYCEMTPKQRELYESVRAQYRAKILEKMDSEAVGNPSLFVLEGIMRLRQICDDPSLIPAGGKLAGESAKLIQLMEHIQEKTGNHKILVFSQFTGMLALIREQLEKERIGYSYLDGKITERKRQEAVRAFQEEAEVRVFLLSLKAGGTGLNLTAGDYVYLVDPWWNPAVENQAIDRCYRIGQDKKVMAYRLICQDSLEEKILAMQEEKRELAENVIGSGESLLSSMSLEAALELFG
ncbi:SNF2-related protein [Algoriphagus sp. D3-2-R+10]|uniref:DEAD/DEAH box helicase n=1 Tax=Algoriphagus aurantiacus TaxID=3103948 RepID=UPI002B3CE128|nr:SNF2-related protein [Algoriphagus sp. D3-2-R+10]MEB2774993.1 SNF2-related protein [Algoriphagus sp. D3-2-R+10]